MNILLVSEGKHELGSEQEIAALATLVRRVVAKEVAFTKKTVRDEAFRIQPRADQGVGTRLHKRALRCLQYATDNGFDALVFVIDQDDDPDRRRHLDLAQESQRLAIGRAFGLAVKTFDAWMIADEKALSQALGLKILRQPDPEKIKDAKSHCLALCGDKEISLSELYTAIATNTDFT